MMVELKNCPFCGGTNCRIITGNASEQVWDYGDFSRAFCADCQVRQHFHRDDNEAITAWNTRATEARIAQLEAALHEWELPEDIASAVRSIGKAEWGATARKSAEDHGDDVANSVRLTAEHFGQTEPQPMHGLYVEGTETVICHTGTSPNSAVHAQALTGAWNWLHARAALQNAGGSDE